MHTRPFDNSDLWAAIRGLGMGRLPDAELRELAQRHGANPLFASKVIAEAARQMLAIRRATRCD